MPGVPGGCGRWVLHRNPVRGICGRLPQDMRRFGSERTGGGAGHAPFHGAKNMRPPFSFRLAEKKTAVHGQKKRALSRKASPLRASVCLLRELLVRSSDRVRQSPAECAPLHRSNYLVPAGRIAEQVSGGRCSLPAPISARSAVATRCRGAAETVFHRPPHERQRKEKFFYSISTPNMTDTT